MPGLWQSLFGSSSPPSGTVDDAFRILRAGRIDEGRTLLRAICRHEPANRDALILTAYELSRAPERSADRQGLLQQIHALDPQRSAVETQTLFAFLDVLQFDGDGYLRAYHGLPAHSPARPPFAALHLLARVLLSDCILQIKLLKPNQLMTKILTHPASQGAAAFVMRDSRALSIFTRGVNDPASTVAHYERYVGRTLTDAERNEALDSVGFECAIGMGVMLLDQDRREEAQAAFRRALQSMYTGPTYDALQVLLT